MKTLLTFLYLVFITSSTINALDSAPYGELSNQNIVPSLVNILDLFPAHSITIQQPISSPDKGKQSVVFDEKKSQLD